MKPGERQLKIIDLLHQQDKVSVPELVSLFGVSAETIRRDLSALSASGKAQKTHGGACAPRIIGEGSFQQRLRKNVSEKRQIAKTAAALIQPGDSLFIDTGSTTLAFAEEVCAIDNLTVITNSSDIARILATSKTAQVYLLGGTYHADNHQSIGPMAISQLKNFRSRRAVLTIGGIHPQAGITDFSCEEALIAQTMSSQAEQTIIVADSSKLNLIAPFAVCSLAQTDYFIAYSAPDDALQHALDSNRVNTVIATHSQR
jgi:DeoR family glycerol-3-phosphate regulon repressor